MSDLEKIVAEKNNVKTRKDIEWAREQIINIDYHFKNGAMKTITDVIGEVMDILNGIEQPETFEITNEWILQRAHWDDEYDAEVIYTGELIGLDVEVPKKPVIPKFVAEYIEQKKNNNINWYVAIHNLEVANKNLTSNESEDNIYKWIFKDMKNTNDFVDAFRYDYEIEQEPLYYVLTKEKRMMLVRKFDGIITEVEPFPISSLAPEEMNEHALSEQEIKDYDERYFAFAVPVGEAE